jgi:hypothetical protein
MGILKFAANAGVLTTRPSVAVERMPPSVGEFLPRYVTSFDLFVVEADLTAGTTKVPVQVVLPAYLQRQMRNVKLHVERSS